MPQLSWFHAERTRIQPDSPVARHLLILSLISALLTFLGVSSAVLFGRSITLMNVRAVDSKIVTALVSASAETNGTNAVRHIQDAFDAVTAPSGEPFYGLALFRGQQVLAANLTPQQMGIVRNEMLRTFSNPPNDPRVHLHLISDDGPTILAEFRTEQRHDFDGLFAFVTLPLSQWVDPNSQDVNWSTFHRKAGGPALISLLVVGLLGVAYSTYLRHRQRRHAQELANERTARFHAVKRVNAELELIRTEHELLQSEKLAAEDRHHASESEREEPRRQLDLEIANRANIESLLRAQEERRQEQEQELAKRESERRRWEKELAQAAERIAARDKEIAAAEQRVAAHEADLGQLARKIEEMRTQDALARTELNRRQASLDEAERSLAKTQQELAELEADIAEKERNLCSSEAQAIALEQAARDRNVLVETIDKIRRDRESKSSELARYQKALLSKEADLKHLREQEQAQRLLHEQALARQSELVEQVHELQEGRSQAERALAAQRGRELQISNELTAANARIEKLKQDSAALERKRKNLEEQSREKENAWQQENARLEERQRKLEERWIAAEKEQERHLKAALQDVERARQEAEKRAKQAEIDKQEWMDLAESYASSGQDASLGSDEEPAQSPRDWRKEMLRCGGILMGMEKLLADRTVDVKIADHHSGDFVRAIGDRISNDPVACRIVRRVTTHEFAPNKLGQMFLEVSRRDGKRWIGVIVDRKKPYTAAVEFVGTTHWEAALFLHVLRARLKSLGKASIRIVDPVGQHQGKPTPALH